jgi:hypothetical protein
LPLRRLTRPRIPDSECANRSVVFERFHGLRARPADHLVVIVGVDALEVDRFLRNAQVGRDPQKGFDCRGEFGGRHLHAHRGIAVLVTDVVLTQRLSQSAGELIQGLWEHTGHGGQLAKNTVKSSYAKSEVQHALGRHRAAGESVTITYRGRPVAVLTPVHSRPRRFSQLPNLAVPVP